MVIIVVLAAAAAAGALAVVTHGFRPKTVLSYQPAAVFALQAGDCLNSSPNGLSATVLSCASPHHAEVFATFSLAGSSWPGSAAVQQQAASGCQDKIAGYLNPALLNAGLDPGVRLPGPDGLEGRSPHHGLRGQLVHRAADRLGPQHRLTAARGKSCRRETDRRIWSRGG